MNNRLKVIGGNRSVYFCPENKVVYRNSDFTYGVRNCHWGTDYERRTSGGVEAWGRLPDRDSSFLALKKVRTPSTTFYLADSVRFGTSNPGAGGYLLNDAVSCGLWEAHTNAVNMLYADGHGKGNRSSVLKSEFSDIGSNVHRDKILRRQNYLIPDPF